MSTPHCSFVINLHQDLGSLPHFIQDFRAFFQKFPLHYELIGVISPAQKQNNSTLETLLKTAPATESWQFISSSKKSRAQNLKLGFEHARSDLIIIPSVVMATPLGDIFKIIQTLMTEPQIFACWGERYSKKIELMHDSKISPLKLENLFNKILKEKFPHRDKDSLCEVGGLRKSAWDQIKNDPAVAKKRGWYLAATCQEALRQKNRAQQNVYVHDSGKRSADFSIWKARWDLLSQSLF